MKKWLALSTSLAVASARSADLDAGRVRVGTVCAACHGAAGVSVSESIPNLAAQRAGYIEAQLKSFKEGTRKAPIMNAIAALLSAADIANVAAYFASLPGAPSGARSELLDHVARSRVTFPEKFKETFTRYTSIDAVPQKQVRFFWANAVALEASRERREIPDGAVLLSEVYSAKLGSDQQPVKGPDGHFVPDQLVSYGVMERQARWGKDIPEMLRNSNWNYGQFTPDRKPRQGVNQAECFACHKPRANASYVFTFDELANAR